MKHSTLVFLSIWSLAAFVGCTSPTPSDGPDNQAPGALLEKAESLTPQSGQGNSFKVAFNENADKVRLVVLLSPT